MRSCRLMIRHSVVIASVRARCSTLGWLRSVPKSRWGECLILACASGCLSISSSSMNHFETGCPSPMRIKVFVA